ncbi:hypothetical protein bAD24_I06245 [Burkholderia sp. AD24]|nr:hypothetical protein bAD24_I06245 [Burkholderia sp. AD24]
MKRTRAVSPAVRVRGRTERTIRTIEDDGSRARNARHGGTARCMPRRTAYYSNGKDVCGRAMPLGGRRVMRVARVARVAQAKRATHITLAKQMA